MLVISKRISHLTFGAYSLAIVLAGGITSYTALAMFNPSNQSGTIEASQRSTNTITPKDTPQPKDSESSELVSQDTDSTANESASYVPFTATPNANKTTQSTPTQTTPVTTVTPSEPAATTPVVTPEPVVEPTTPTDPPTEPTQPTEPTDPGTEPTNP